MEEDDHHKHYSFHQRKLYEHDYLQILNIHLEKLFLVSSQE